MPAEELSTSSESSVLITSSGRARRPLQYRSINIANVNAAPDDEVRSRSAAVMSRYKYYGRLAPHAESPMLMPDHIVPPEVWSHSPLPVTGKQNSLVTIFSIWNTMMGTSLLSMPWAIGQAGFGLGLALLIFMAGLTLYTSYRIMKSVDFLGSCEKEGQVIEFSDVCRHYLGRVGEYTAVTFSVIALLGGAIVYWVLMSNFLYNTVEFIYAYIKCSDTEVNKTNKSCDVEDFMYYNTSYGFIGSEPIHPHQIPSSIWDMQNTVPLFLLLVLVPLINFKSATFFTKFNSLGTLSVMYLLVFVTYKAAIWGFHLDLSGDDGHVVKGTYAAPNTFPALTGILALAYFIHNCVLSIVRNQAKPENNGRDLTIAFICVSATYTYVGGLFYATWPQETKSCIDENLLNNFLNADPLAFVARIFLFLQMVTVFPLLLYIMRLQVMHVLFGSIWPSLKHVLVLNALVVAVCVVFAVYLPHIGQIIRFTGALCGLVYAFFLPCTTYMLQKKEQQELTKASLIFHVTLIILGVVNFIAQFLLL